MGKEKVFGICKLCGITDYLCDSHIIPRFFYKYFFNGKETLLASTEQIRNDEQVKPLKESFNGFYDKDILCSNCDNNIIGRYDDYVAKFICKEELPKNWNIEGYKTNNAIYYKNVDYIRYKLFFLSLIWRAHHSSQKIFQEVDLGPHENIIRKMILDNNPGSSNKYPIIPILGKYESIEDMAYIGQFTKVKKSGSFTAYRMPFGGFIFLFLVSGHKIKDDIISNSINEQGFVKIILKEKKEMMRINLSHLGLIK